METVEKLLSLDCESLKQRKTKKIEIERLTKEINKKGIKGKFEITVESLPDDVAFEYGMDMLNNQMQMDKDNLLKVSKEICTAGIIDPKLNDSAIKEWCGLKETASAKEVLCKILNAIEIVNVGTQIITLSNVELDNNKEIENIKN